MSEEGWTTNRPTMGGLYWMRREGTVDGSGRVIEIVPPNKYRPSEGAAEIDLPESGVEYKVVDGYASSA